jgi:hypothetical protein
MASVLQRREKLLDRTIFSPGREMSSGSLADGLEPMQNRYQGKKLVVNERDAVGRMSDEREPKRFAKSFHQGTVDELGTQLDGVIRHAPVSLGTNPPAGLCTRLEANGINAYSSRLGEGRHSRDTAPDDEVIRFRSQLGGLPHGAHRYRFELARTGLLRSASDAAIGTVRGCHIWFWRKTLPGPMFPVMGATSSVTLRSLWAIVAKRQ